jgi:hypothetical protein
MTLLVVHDDAGAHKLDSPRGRQQKQPEIGQGHHAFVCLTRGLNNRKPHQLQQCWSKHIAVLLNGGLQLHRPAVLSQQQRKKNIYLSNCASATAQTQTAVLRRCCVHLNNQTPSKNLARQCGNLSAAAQNGSLPATQLPNNS